MQMRAPTSMHIVNNKDTFRQLANLDIHKVRGRSRALDNK